MKMLNIVLVFLISIMNIQNDPIQLSNINTFFKTLSLDPTERQAALSEVERTWQDGYLMVMTETLRFSSNDEVTNDINDLMNKKSGQNFSPDAFSWYQYLWKQNFEAPPFYSDFKGEIYQHIDPKFKAYFEGRQNTAKIKIEEIVWGGVNQDGIPPLRDPKKIKASEASYLSDSDIVFGVEINGRTVAYPKRILAWHEFFVDNFGDKRIAGVYCTLCGTVIAYDSHLDGKDYDLGTSGFLYRSNKLMYDRKTQSLWNTITGEPVLGPLTKKDIKLNSYYLVTTTWGEWKSRHPETEVLDLNTGYQRNYNEGEAYRSYFGSDRLMFPVPLSNNSLNNKDEVLIIRDYDYETDPVAVSINFLKDKPIYQYDINKNPIVVLTDKSGAARAYENINNLSFYNFDGDQVQDSNGQIYQAKEDGLFQGSKLVFRRLPSHSIFWFAWFNTYPNTRLLK